jgi:hypothetical protein
LEDNNHDPSVNLELKARRAQSIGEKLRPLLLAMDIMNRYQDEAFNAGGMDVRGVLKTTPLCSRKWSWMRRIGKWREWRKIIFRPHRKIRHEMFRVCPKQQHPMLLRLIRRSCIFVGRDGTYDMSSALYDINRLFVMLIYRCPIRTACMDGDSIKICREKPLPPHHFVVTDYHSRSGRRDSLFFKAVTELILRTKYCTQSDIIEYNSEYVF